MMQMLQQKLQKYKKLKYFGDEEWQEDDDYIIKQYEVKSSINISKYSVNLEDVPEGTLILNSENEQKQEFSSNEKFKISIPKENIKESGKFKIKVKTEMETKPVFFGKAPSENYQDYALTTYSFEDISLEKTD